MMTTTPIDGVRTRYPRRSLRTAFLLTALCASASSCRENTRSSVLSPAAQRIPTTAALLVERVRGSDTIFAVTLQLTSDETMARIGSFSVTIDFDSTRLHFVTDSSPASDALRAAHPDRGRVRVAAASATGLAPELLARLLFTGRDTLALRALRLEVTELHQLDATDLRKSLVVQSSPTINGVVSP